MIAVTGCLGSRVRRRRLAAEKSPGSFSELSVLWFFLLGGQQVVCARLFSESASERAKMRERKNRIRLSEQKVHALERIQAKRSEWFCLFRPPPLE